jgi:phospholipid transport system transporter-binding protein
LVLPAELTHAHASACSRMLAQALRFDSSALAVLLECRREALSLGKTFAVAHLPARLRELAALYGVAELLPAAP